MDHNRGTIGICLIGGFEADADDQFGLHFTSAQARALRADIRSRTQIAKVTGHNTYAAKACPGFRVAGWIYAPHQPLPIPDPPKPAARCRRNRRTCALKGDFDAYELLAVVVLEKGLGLRVPGVALGDDWMLVLMNAIGLGTLRHGIQKSGF